MSSLWSQLKSYFTGDIVSNLSKSARMSTTETTDSLKDTFSFLLGGLSKNVEDPSAAEKLSDALQKDHDGSIFSNVSEYLSNPEAKKGKGILNHIFGGKTEKVENYLSEHHNLDQKGARKFLEESAPLFMGALGKTKLQDHLQSGDIAALIQQTFLELREKNPEKYSKILQLLDKDGDGEIVDDIPGLGFLGFFTKFFKKK